MNYAAKAVKASGVPMDPDVITGVMVPVVALLIWNGVRRFRNRIERDEA